MSGKDKRSLPDTGGGSHIEESTKGATSSGGRVLPSVVATSSGRRVVPNVGRKSDVEETDRRIDEAACSDDHKTPSSHADDSTDSNLKGKKKESFVSNIARQFSSEQTTETQHQLKPKTQSCEKGEKKKELPKQGKNKTKECRPNLEEQSLKENLKIHVNKNVEGLSTSASAGESMKGENLSKSFVVLTSDGEDEIELNVEMGNQDCFSVSVGLNDTVEAVMLKIEEKKGFSCENQRLVMDGNQLYKTDTLLSHGIDKDATIHLVVKTENDADKAEGDSSSGLEGNPTEVPDTSNNSESKDKRDAMENNRTEETDPSCSSQQDSTENGNGASQIEKSEPRIPNSPSPTPTSDIASKYLQGEQGSGMLTHPKDSQMKEKVMKSQQLIPDSKSSPKSAFMKSNKESTTKVEKLTTKVSNDGSDMNQEKEDTEIENEGEMKIPQTPETEVEKKTPQTPETEVEKKTPQTPETEGEKKTHQTPDTEGEKKTHQTPETEGEKDTKDDLNIVKMDKDPDCDDESEDDQQSLQKFVNDLSKGDDDPSTENLKVQSLQRDDEVLDDSGSHLSESNSVEIISEEDHEEEIRGGENFSIPSFSMTSMTQIPDDNNTDFKPQTDLCSTHGTGDDIVHGVNNAAKMPETNNAEGEKEIKHFVDDSVKSEECKTIQQFSETPVFSIQKVGDFYTLHGQNPLMDPLILPQLEGVSNVSVSKNMILINSVPKYFIKIKNGNVKISELRFAEIEVNRSESSNTKRSGHDLSAEIQEHKGAEEGLGLKKVRKTTPDMQNVLNPPQENETNPLNLHDTVADDNTGGSSGDDVKKEESKIDVDDITCKFKKMGIEDAPGEQQQSLEEAVYNDEKPPIPAPRSKSKENKLENEHDSKSLPTPPPRSRRNSQNQPPEMKIQEPMNPKTQPMYKKVTFKVTYTLTGSSERKEIEKEKMMGQLDYMKWKFATIDLKSLCKKLQSASQKQNYLFHANDGIMQVDIGSVSDASQIEKHIDYIVDMVIEYSKNCVVKSVPFKHEIRGEDVEIAVQELSVMKDGIYYAEINNEEFHVIMICHRDIADQIVAKIRDKISKLGAGSKTHTRIIEKSPVLRKKIDKESFKELLKQRFPSIDLRMNYIKTNHKLLVTFAGPKTEVDEAIAMIEHYYPCNEISFTDVKYSSEFSNIVDVLCEFTCSLQIDKDISVDINAENKKIGICSTSLDTNTDEVTNIIKKCIKRKEIKKQVGDPDFTSDLLGEIKEKYDGKQKPYIHLTFVNEGSIMVYGLKEHLDSCFSNIEKMVHVEGKAGSTVPKSSKEQSQPSSSCVKEIIRIENPLVYECICKSKQFSSVAERNDIQVKQLNTNVKGFVIDGSKEAVDSVKNEIKEIEKSIKVHTLDCKVEANHVPNFLEHIHNFDNVVVREENIQIDSISYDSKKTQWIFAQGSTVQIAKSCSLPGKKVLVRFEEESINAKQGVTISGSDIVVFFPKWKDGRAKEKINLTEMFNECLQACLNRSSHHIDVMVGEVSWKMQTFVKQLLLPLKELLQKRMTPCLSVCFCGSDPKICDDIYKACCGYFKGGFSSMPADDGVNVTILKGNLADTEADILVNTLDRTGNLEVGAISWSLLNKAGNEKWKLKAEMNKFKHPLQPFKIYQTPSFFSNCRVIFHGFLQSYTAGDSKEKLKGFVLECLKEAERCKYCSIAFPALGAGNLKYPLDDVKTAFFDAVEEFNKSCKSRSSLQDVKFVLYDPNIYQDFKAEKIRRGMKESDVPDSHRYGNITLKAEKGCIRDIKQDCILYLWEKSVVFSVRGKQGQNHAVLKEMDEFSKKEFFKSFFPEGRFNCQAFRTINCKNLGWKDVIHVPYEDISYGKEKALTTGIRLAITLEKTSVGLYFDDANPFLRGGNFMTHVANALSDLSSNLSQPLDVVVFVGNNFFDKAMTFFKESTQKASAVQPPKPVQPPKTENVVMTVVGTKSNLTAAVDYLKNQKEVILMELHMPQEDEVDANPKPALLNAPGAMIMERGPDSTDMQSSSTHVQNANLERTKELECYVEMQNIPKGETISSLSTKILTLRLPIVCPELVYCNGSDTAIIICTSVEDAKKLENMQKSGFIFKGYDGKKSYTKVSWNFPKAKDLQPEDKDELKKIHVNVDEVTGKIETLTTYQLKCAKAILAKYDKQEVTETQEGINENELVTIANRIEMEATEDVWNIVSEICKKDIISFEKKCGPVKFENSKIVIPAHDTDVAKNVQKLKTGIQEMMKKEIAEILIDSKKVKKPDVPGFCKEVDESFGYECCVWNPDKNKVYAYDDTYEKVLMVKHKFSITSGLTKPTGQNRRKNRGAAHIQSNDDTASDELKSDNRFERSLKKTSVEHSSKITSVYQSDKEQCYKFGYTLVKVYKGDILNLNVDCIVNAANKSLSHGGGVAEVIARAAGYSLTKEGDDYIAQHGEIPVGHAIATTAGILHYKCVIHTVGPRWCDYKSRSHDDVQRCKDDLYHAIFNCFTIAERRELRSIAIPAISSAIFGVPMEICVEQYARATLSYCKNAAEATALSEIHFIDIKPKTVKKIQEAFEAKQRGASVEITSGADSEGFGATSFKTREENTGELPEPLAYEEGWKQNVFRFLDSEKLNVYCKDIFSVKANGIVVSVNEKGKWGAIGQTIFNKIPKYYLPSFNGDFERKINQGTKTGDVIVNGGYSCGYRDVLLVIYPYEARHKPQDERQAALERAYKNVFLAARDKQIHTIVTTLFGIESNNDDQVKFAANCFLKSYLEYCKQKLMEKESFQMEVTIVCQTEHAHGLVCEVFMKYVQDQKHKEMDKTSASENPPDDTKASAGELEDCVICLEGIKEPKRLDCGHTFCEECIEQHFKFAQKCPTCGHVCGKITGDQPDGTMNVYVQRYQHLTGYYSYDTIAITYTFQDGKQREDHPNPGKWYKGIQRRAYLPNNKEGRKIAKMLKVAFERKLVFTIGSSRTTGQEGVITWNDIHHKTDSRPNTQFGYPDPTYLERVKDELAAKGVTENDIDGVTL